MKKLIAWLKEPFYTIDEPKRADWAIIAISIIIALAFMTVLTIMLNTNEIIQ